MLAAVEVDDVNTASNKFAFTVKSCSPVETQTPLIQPITDKSTQKPGSLVDSKKSKMYICAEETEDTGLTEVQRRTVTEKQAKVADYRFPMFLGNWKVSKPYVNEGFAKDDLDEPHVKRRITILNEHPEIEKLYGYDSSSQYITLLCVGIQVLLAYSFGRFWTENNWAMLFISYIVGASITQILGVILHECTHALVAEDALANKIYGLIANIAIPFPIAMSFRRYHLEHHAYQGVPGKDPDLPLSFEYNFVQGNAFMKFVWLFFYPAMYVIRGAVFGRDISKWEAINIATTLASDAIIVATCGWRGFFYLFMSLWLGYGIHPAAAHFIQEHYTTTDGQETYSYYGSFNRWFLNIGFHNEHHDFPKVPWSRLPDVKKLAPEFYNTLKAHYSWWKVLYNLVMDPQIGPQSRVSRSLEAHKVGRRMIRIRNE